MPTTSHAPTSRVAAVGAAWVVLVAATAGGLLPLSLIDAMVLLGIAVVLPLSVGGRAWAWEIAAGCAFVSFVSPVGAGGVFVLPFVGVALGTLASKLRAAGAPLSWRIADAADVTAADVVDVVPAAYAVVAAAALLQSRCGLELFGIHEPIIELTAVHFIFAGSASVVLAVSAARHATARWRHLGVPAVVFTALAPPVIAVGFVTRAALPQIGGAVLMTVGVWLIAALHLRAAVTTGWSIETSLLAVSGLAVWVPMVLAVAWASGQHFDLPVLSVPDMARTHGLANGIGFVLCGLLGRRMHADTARRHDTVSA